MNLKVKNVLQIKGTVKAPPSKSYTHRAVILASLAKGKSKLKDPLIAEDTLTSLNTCKDFGINIEEFDGLWIVDGSSGKFEVSKDEIDLGNSGTTLRIMTSLATLSNKEIIFTGDDSLKTRPMEALLTCLEKLGGDVKSLNNNGKAPMLIKPGFKGGICEIAGNISSQFISSLLITGALGEIPLTIKIKGQLLSKPYIDMTRDLMSKFGVKTECEIFKTNDSISYSFFVKPQKYISCDYTVEGDYSSASYILSAVAICGGQVKVKNLFKESIQGDKLILDILKKMGSEIEINNDNIVIKSNGDLKGIAIDLHNAPDLLPTVAVLGALAIGKTTIYGVEHARYKETDRIAICAEELSKLGCKLKENLDGLEITGGLKSGTVKSHKDHRLAMAFSLIGLKYDIAIEDGEVFDISFPNFIELMGEIGVEMELVG